MRPCAGFPIFPLLLPSQCLAQFLSFSAQTNIVALIRRFEPKLKYFDKLVRADASGFFPEEMEKDGLKTKVYPQVWPDLIWAPKG